MLVRKNTRTIDFPDFDLDTLLLPVFAAPNDDILIESLQDNEISTLREAGRFVLPDSRENVILSAMADKTTVCPFTGSPRCATS
ncbi:MAG: hypothetical protein LIO46_04475 [Clostridiales bacterium]|nr:hypothetical protein [Clostridiales bacterium]